MTRTLASAGVREVRRRTAERRRWTARSWAPAGLDLGVGGGAGSDARERSDTLCRRVALDGAAGRELVQLRESLFSCDPNRTIGRQPFDQPADTDAELSGEVWCGGGKQRMNIVDRRLAACYQALWVLEFAHVQTG